MVDLDTVDLSVNEITEDLVDAIEALPYDDAFFWNDLQEAAYQHMRELNPSHGQVPIVAHKHPLYNFLRRFSVDAPSIESTLPRFVNGEEVEAEEEEEEAEFHKLSRPEERLLGILYRRTPNRMIAMLRTCIMRTLNLQKFSHVFGVTFVKNVPGSLFFDPNIYHTHHQYELSLLMMELPPGE